MGIIWKSTMPLLSTLAALVIIVHSAEEEMNRGYRELRPRAVETASYEQPWKAIDVDPVHPPTRAQAWIESPEEIPTRRRPVRKRKRRPVPYPDSEPQERYQERIIQLPYRNDNHERTIEPPRRRRRPEYQHHDLINNPKDRPTRRRGLRKKRPDFDGQSQLAEISELDYDQIDNKDEYADISNKYNIFNDDDYVESKTTEKLAAKLDANDQVTGVNYWKPFNETQFYKDKDRYSYGTSESKYSMSDEEDSGVSIKVEEEIKTQKPTTEIADNANPDITTTENIPKEYQLKLGVRINGTEHSYVSLIIPSRTISSTTATDLTTHKNYRDGVSLNNNNNSNTIVEELDKMYDAVLRIDKQKEYLRYGKKPAHNIFPGRGFTKSNKKFTIEFSTPALSAMEIFPQEKVKQKIGYEHKSPHKATSPNALLKYHIKEYPLRESTNLTWSVLLKQFKAIGNLKADQKTTQGLNHSDKTKNYNVAAVPNNNIMQSSTIKPNCKNSLTCKDKKTNSHTASSLRKINHHGKESTNFKWTVHKKPVEGIFVLGFPRNKTADNDVSAVARYHVMQSNTLKANSNINFTKKDKKPNTHTENPQKHLNHHGKESTNFKWKVHKKPTQGIFILGFPRNKSADYNMATVASYYTMQHNIVKPYSKNNITQKDKKTNSYTENPLRNIEHGKESTNFNWKDHKKPTHGNFMLSYPRKKTTDDDVATVASYYTIQSITVKPYSKNNPTLFVFSSLCTHKDEKTNSYTENPLRNIEHHGKESTNFNWKDHKKPTHGNFMLSYLRKKTTDDDVATVASYYTIQSITVKLNSKNNLTHKDEKTTNHTENPPRHKNYYGKESTDFKWAKPIQGIKLSNESKNASDDTQKKSTAKQRKDDLTYKEKETSNLHLSIPPPNFFLTYGVPNNHTKKFKDLSQDYQSKQNENIHNLLISGKSTADFDEDGIQYILFPLSKKKFIAIYYTLENEVKKPYVDLRNNYTENNTELSTSEEYTTTLSHDDVKSTSQQEIYEESTKYPLSVISLLDAAKRFETSSKIYSETHHPKKSNHVLKWINTKKRRDKQKYVLKRGEMRSRRFQFVYLPEELEENGAIDPLMLKQLLKRSNGSSLSEMLQRHNLSLSDLLQGRNEAISAVNAEAEEPQLEMQETSLESNSRLKQAETKYPATTQPTKERVAPTEFNSEEDTRPTVSNKDADTTKLITNKNVNETKNQESRPKMSTRQRFPTATRRKLRMRPTFNSTLKAQLSRDLIALSTRKYAINNKNVTKSREWKEIVPMMPDRSKTVDKTINEEVTEYAPTTTDAPFETTISDLEISNSFYKTTAVAVSSNERDNEVENSAATTTEAPTTTTIETIEILPEEIMSEMEKRKVTPIMRPTANNSTLRRQALNNRLKRKRLKQKSTTENPSDDLMRNFLGMANLVSASQFIESTQKPYTTVQLHNTETTTDLEDFMSTITPIAADGGLKTTHTDDTTEQSAKFEIEEILNDTMTSERLSKILRERNMTLNELVNHRERGSSHVHLADIFHNASKEPNPPEPFLTKSSIEPISKETYPLRAILEANTHETTTKMASTQDQRNVNIPVVMDFGNNVNENSESMGIISLFNKMAENEVIIEKTELRTDSNGTPYVSSVVSVNSTNSNDTNRESRVLGDADDWNELLSFMRSHNITTFEEDVKTINKESSENTSLDDLDDDSLTALEDLEHLTNFASNIASDPDGNIETNKYETRENLSEKPGILNKLPNNTKSVAIATASILGLAAILFLLTYVAFKWKQSRNKLRNKESLCEGKISTPVFENRKGHKNNCSSRSISPMISNTNIYMSTLESSGKESPEYMWNSLRKPFQ